MVGEQIVQDATQQVVKSGGNFLTRLLSSPFDFIVGLGKGVFKGATNIMGVLTTGGIIAGLSRFAPDLVKWIPIKIGDKTVGEHLAEAGAAEGTGGILKTSAIAALAVNGAIGGVTGAIGEVTGASNGKEESGFLGKAGGLLLGAGAVVGVVMLAKKGLDAHGVGFTGESDTGTKSPGLTPDPTKSEPAKTQGK